MQVRDQLLAAGAASVASVVLLDKKARRKVGNTLAAVGKSNDQSPLALAAQSFFRHESTCSSTVCRWCCWISSKAG
jgi:hypothetical protein